MLEAPNGLGDPQQSSPKRQVAALSQEDQLCSRHPQTEVWMVETTAIISLWTTKKTGLQTLSHFANSCAQKHWPSFTSVRLMQTLPAWSHWPVLLLQKCVCDLCCASSLHNLENAPWHHNFALVTESTWFDITMAKCLRND